MKAETMDMLEAEAQDRSAARIADAAAMRKRIAELEAALTEIRADLDVQFGRLRVDANWPQFKKMLGE